MNEDLLNVVQDFKEIKKKEKLSKLDDNVLFETAVKTYISKEISKSKGRGYGQQRNIELKNPSAPASEKQIAFLQKLGIEVPEEGLSKAEAHQLIEENKKNVEEY